MRTTLALLLLPAVLGGCAGGSGIIAVGPGTYLVSALRAPAVGGGREAYRVVLAEAEAYCDRQGQHALTLQIRPSGDPFTPFYPTAFDHVFRCSAKQAVLF